MPAYIVPAADGVTSQPSKQQGELYHDLAVKVTGSAPAGTMVVKARKPGSGVFESIPDGSFDLSALNSIQFTGAVKEFQFEISNLTGVNSITVTDTAQRV